MRVLDRAVHTLGIPKHESILQVLWASAVAVSEIILADPDLVRGKRLASVGCGLALDGIAAALAGVPK